MALQKQNFVISLAKGIDTKTDSSQVIAGKLLVLENGIFTSPTEIRKRNGNQAFNNIIKNNSTFSSFNTVPSTMKAANFLTSFKEEMAINDGVNLYSYSSALTNQVYKGQNTICDLTVTPVIRNRNSQTKTDSAIDPHGIQIFTWLDSSDSNSHLSIVDTTTGQILIADRIISPSGGGATTYAKCAYIAGKLVVLYLDSTVNMKLYYFSYANGIFSSPIVLATDVNTNISNNNYDISVADNKIYVAYNTSTPSVKITYLDAFLVQGTTITKAGTNANSSICVFTDQISNVWIGYCDATHIKAFVVNNLVTITVLAPTVVDTINVENITGVGFTSNALFFYDTLGSADTNGNFSNAEIDYNTLTTAGVAGTPAIFIKSASLQSKAFLITASNGVQIPQVIISHDANLQPTYFLANLYNLVSGAATNFNIVSKIAPSLAGGPPGRQSLSSINIFGTNIYQSAILQKDLLFTSSSSTGTVNSFTQTGVMSAILDFSQTNFSTSTLGNNLHIGSGMISMYDGTNVVEHNFHLYPEALTLTINAAGGHLTDSASYGYQVVYEWTDNQGQLHKSSPSPVISKNTTATGTNISQGVLVIPTLRITAKTNVNIVVYRTQANGTVYYRLNLPTAPLANSLTSNTVTYTDNATDASIAANEQLYTTGGEVVNTGAPASGIMGIYKNRIILIPSENPYSWWFSKQVIPGSPVEFSDLFVENIGSAGGPITAISQLDSNLILFKDKSIWYVVGDGPAPSGANNDFTDALQIASDVGCIDLQSVVLTPMGLMFKSHKGIYLLNRGLAVQYIGADVEGFNQYNVTSSQLIVSTNQVRFTLSNGICLVYDYFVQQWSTFTNINAVASTVNMNNFTFVQSNGLILQETPGVFNDNGNFIKLRLATSWLSLAGMEGFQRLYKLLILGKYMGPHQLLTQFAYDFNPVFTQQEYINAASLINTNIYGEDQTYGLTPLYGGPYASYQWRIFPQRQTCTSLQISIEDIAVTGPFVDSQGQTIQQSYNEGLSLSSLTLEIGQKRGGNKLSANRSF